MAVFNWKKPTFNIVPVAVLCAALATQSGLARAQSSPSAVAPTTAAASAAVPTVALPDFASLVDRVGPAVVNIRAKNEPRTRRAEPGALFDEQMLEFMRRFGLPIPEGLEGFGGFGPADPDDDGSERGGGGGGVGSGFILSADGFILTNAHVVEGAASLHVTLHDKREFRARVIGADARTDVAVLKIEASGLPTVRIGDVGRLRVGEWVMAIGSPFGLENTVTAGIVSAKQRDTGEYLPFIQTDVAINPGNSGGPLINLRGEVVGINSQIYSRSGGFMGISFAIPIDEALRVSDQLRTHGKVTRGRIGVQIAPVTPEVADSIGLGAPRGALISSVEPNSPAARAGLEAGDVLLQFNGVAVDKMADLPRLVGSTAPGTHVGLSVLRRGRTLNLHLIVDEMPSTQASRAGGPRPNNRDDANKGVAVRRLGLEVAELDAAQRQKLNLTGGVRVTAVTGAARAADVRAGDVITAVLNQEVKSVADFQAAVEKAPKNRPIHVLVRRDQWAQYIVIRPKD